MIDTINEWLINNLWITSFFTLILGAYLNNFLTKNKEITMKMAEKKGQYYAEYISALMEFSKSQDNIQYKTHEINKHYYYLKNLVILYGSDQVIDNLAQCEENGINFSTDKGKTSYLNLIDSMKKDIENPRVIRSWIKIQLNSNSRKNNIETILFNYKKGK